MLNVFSKSIGALQEQFCAKAALESSASGHSVFLLVWEIFVSRRIFCEIEKWSVRVQYKFVRFR